MYLKYLLVHPDGYDNEQVIRMCKLQQLDFVGESYLDRLRKGLVTPVPFYPYMRRNMLSRRFLMRNKLWILFHPDEEMDAATELLNNARAKEKLETMLLSEGVQPVWIASALNRQGFRASSGAVDMYKRYYFDTGLIDSTEMRALLEMRLNTDSGDDRQYEPLKRAFKSDSRITASEMQVPVLATMSNMVRMGFMPSHVEVARIATAARAMATVRTLESVIRGGNYDAERGERYAMIAKHMNEMIEAIGSPEEDLQHQLSTITLHTDEASIPSIKQLGGTHTLDVMPIHSKGEVIDVEPE